MNSIMKTAVIMLMKKQHCADQTAEEAAAEIAAGIVTETAAETELPAAAVRPAPRDQEAAVGRWVR